MMFISYIDNVYSNQGHIRAFHMLQLIYIFTIS